MTGMMHYLSGVSFCLILLFMVYWFFLRRDTFFMINRLYLISMVALSLAFPLIPLHWARPEPTNTVAILLDPVLITPEAVESVVDKHLGIFEMALVVYLTGVALFFIRFLIQLIQLGAIVRRFGVTTRHGQTLVLVDRGYAPFSFFDYIFINEASVAPGCMQTIIAHERVHIRQWHSLDLVLVELATILQWFNPVIWIAGREIKRIHEYLADEGVLQNGIHRSIYQQMILDESMGIRVNGLTNHFNVSLLKNRITMMSKSKSGAWSKTKVLLAIPSLLLLGLFLSSGTATSVNSDPAAFAQDKQKQAQVKKTTTATGDNTVYTVVEKLPSFPGGQDGYVKFLVENIKYPAEAKKNKIQGTVFVTFVVETDGRVSNVKILRGIGSGCDEEAQRVVAMMPNWNPGEEKGKPVRVQYNLPIRFKLDDKKKEESGK
jgi:TonB family protein